MDVVPSILVWYQNKEFCMKDTVYESGSGQP